MVNEVTSKFRMRRATIEDLPKIVELLADDILGRSREDGSSPLNPAYLEAFAAIESDPSQMLVVAEYRNEIAGSLQLSFIPGLSRLGMLRGQIEGVRVATAKRNLGIGKLMIEWAIDECKKRGCGTVQLTSDKSRVDALRFYESLGFKASHLGMKLTLKE